MPLTVGPVTDTFTAGHVPDLARVVQPNFKGPLFDRKVRFILDGLFIEDMRVSFKVKRTLKKHPNTCEVSVYNLSESHRAAFQTKKHLPLILEAGYETNIAQLFSGDTRYVDQVQEGADWITKAKCGDGEKQYEYRRINQSFRGGTTVASVIQSVAAAMGLKATGLDGAKALTEQFVQGYAAFGKASVELDHLLLSRGFEWSIQDGVLQVLPVDGTTTETVVFLSPETGLIGSPAHGCPERENPVAQLDPEAMGLPTPIKGKKGPAFLKAKSLLQSSFRPGRRVQIESRGTNGVFKIHEVEHTGDTMSGDWYSEISCLPVAPA